MYTKQLKSLQEAKPHPIPISADDHANILLAEWREEINRLSRYAITVNHDPFLDLLSIPHAFYVREGYEELLHVWL